MKTETTKKLHSNLGASSADRWMKCPGSPKLCLSAPPMADSVHAREGTAAHALAEMCLTKNEIMVGAHPKDHIGETIQGFEVTEEMAEAVGLYVDTVRADQKATKSTLIVEKKFDLSSVFRGMWGTNDAINYARWGKLIVYDYKHGQGQEVEVVDNPQLLYYALGAYIEYGDAQEFSEVELVIVQPRADHRDGPVRRWAIPVTYLTAFSDTLRKAAEATMKPDAPLKTGPHCRWCPALPICPEAARKVQETALADFSEPTVKLPDPAYMTVDQIKKVLDFAGFVDDWIKSVEAYAESQVKAGFPIPGYKLVRKRSIRKWINEEEAAKVLKSKYGEKVFTKPELLSPAQIEKIIGKKDGGAIEIETLSETPDTGVVLVPEKDKRPAVQASVLTDFT